jgi:ribose transport system ATP-binding protein
MRASKLETRCLTKVYPGTVALKDFSVRFEGGEVHALVGKNGSGKSTAVKILAGSVAPTSGSFWIDGKQAVIHSPQDAFHNGIATVYQELSSVPSLSVAENVLMGRLPKRGSFIDWKRSYSLAQEILDSMGSKVSAHSLVGELSIGQRQIVEIAKARSYHPSVIMLDEPTSALARAETESLFAVINELKKAGVAILYITHRLHELAQIADMVTVLRDGVKVGTVAIAEASPSRIVDMMFGEVAHKARPSDLAAGSRILLEARGLTRSGAFHDVSFRLREGEILGIAGMLGSGRSELLRAVFGADPFDSGEVLVEGRLASSPSPESMKRRGVAMTPENRKEEGLIQSLSTRENLCLANLGRISRRGFIRQALERQIVERQIRDLEILVPDDRTPVATLSGGNQQKVVVGNWLNTSPKVILLDEPSRGIDVNAKQQIFQIVWKLARDGISSIIVSTELEELLEVCGRILVMRYGRIVGEVDPTAVSVGQLYTMAMGDWVK